MSSNAPTAPTADEAIEGARKEFSAEQEAGSWAQHDTEISEEPDGLTSLLERLGVDRRAFEKFQSDYRQSALLNNGVMAGVYFNVEVLDSAPSVRIPDVQLALFRATYAPHSSFEEFWSLIEPVGGVVVIVAPPDTGRSALAYALLARLRYESLAEEVHRLTFGGSNTLPGRRLPREPGRAYLLELPPDEESSDGKIEFGVSNEFGDHLIALRDVLARRKARLVVLARPNQWVRITRGVRSDFAPNFGTPPLPIDIARGVLRVACPISRIERWLGDQRIARLFQGAAPVDAIDIADLIISEDRPGGDQSHSDCPSLSQIDNVVNARSSWREDLLRWHREDGRTAIQRNFLLAAAILRDAPVGHIYAKAADLCEAFSDSELELSGQAAPGIIELLSSVEGELASAERISFRRPHWEDAAVEYFWIDRPLSRQVFVKWLAETPLASSHGDLVKISQDDSLQIGRRVVDFAVRFAVRHERPLPLAALVETWDRQRSLWTLLVDAIDAAAIADASSPYIRKMLLDWAKTSEASKKRLVAAVCARSFGAIHTGFALRRLRHIGDACPGTVLPDLQDAVIRLWSDDAARVTLLQYLGAWCRDDHVAGPVVFQTLALLKDAESKLPQVLSVFSASSFSGVSIDVLEIAWRRLLDRGDLTIADSPLQKCVDFWMASALESDGSSRIFAVLSAAVSGATGSKASVRRELLRGSVRRWVEDGPGSSNLKHALQRDLSEVLDAEIVRSVRRIAAREDSR
ncbi:hypothetical protein [Micromonospora sp. NPDC023814]|uniref:hypothetical protein n=1 Tax=Micromonospora sp. NPDC023814 TaxID=3154596 RepID=UPI0033D6F8E3